MKIYDAHTHIFPEKIAHKAAVNIGKFYDIDMYEDAFVEKLKSSSAQIGTEKMLVCSSAVVESQVESINTFIAKACDENSEFLGLAAMHPKFEDFEIELDRALNMGLVGVKFHPDFQKFNIDDDSAVEMYSAIAKRKMPVLFHMGDNRYDFSSPKRLVNLMEKVPELVVHAAHFGGYMAWDEAYDCLPVCDRLVFDTSSALFLLDKKKVYSFVEKFGVDKFMFGTDFPMWNPKEELDRFLSLGFDDNTNRAMFYENFERFYCGLKHNA